MMRIDKTGVTRLVILTENYAVKVPRFWSFHTVPFLRGYLANQSEWRQRRRPEVERSFFNLFNLALVSRRAIEVGTWEPEEAPDFCRSHLDETDENEDEGYSHNDELKGSSWGLFPDGWLLIDYDRAFEQEGRGLLGKLYYGHQERLARRWSQLPDITLDVDGLVSAQNDTFNWSDLDDVVDEAEKSGETIVLRIEHAPPLPDAAE